MNQSISDQIEHMPELSDEEKHWRILAGLADVAAGRLIPHEEVRSWARSLFRSSQESNESE